jgi:glycosyltransferase involved in cell wall biosynthesis
VPDPAFTDFPNSPPSAALLPQRLLYTTSARLGGSGLDVSSLEGVRAAYRDGRLGKVIAFANQQEEIPAQLVRSLAWHPVRALSWLDSEYYYGAKKHYVDWVAERELRHGHYDAFHGWSGDALRTLVAARQMKIPSVLDIPTWHRNKGQQKGFFSRSEREIHDQGGGTWKEKLVPSRQRNLLEYELADVLFMPSTRAAETFLDAGIPAEKLHYVARGVNPDAFQPHTPPPLFRLIFVGALIERKGVHHLLRAWQKLNLPDAELLLVGSLHPEMEPVLRECSAPSIKLAGFVQNVPAQLATASAFVFPSELEGAAKSTFEAAAAGLAQITTRASGDAVVDGVNGKIIPPNDPDALAEAIRAFYDSPAELVRMGAAGRQRMIDHFTWDHFRKRILHGYAKARTRLGA